MRPVRCMLSQWSSLACHPIVDDDILSAWQIISNLGWVTTRTVGHRVTHTCTHTQLSLKDVPSELHNCRSLVGEGWNVFKSLNQVTYFILSNYFNLDLTFWYYIQFRGKWYSLSNSAPDHTAIFHQLTKLEARTEADWTLKLSINTNNALVVNYSYYFKYGCCCKKSLKTETLILYTYAQPGSTEDLYIGTVYVKCCHN